MIKIDGTIKVSPYKKTECQDNISYGTTQNYAWGIVYDGAGSLKLSGEAGAKIVYIAGLLLQQDTSIENTWTAISTYLPMYNKWKQMGGTLALFRGNKQKLETLVIGDAFAVINSNNKWQLITGEENTAEYANETKLITSKGITPITKTFTNVEAVGISSDGLEKLTLKNKQPFINFWDKAINLPASTILKLIEKTKRQDDDLGFIIAKFK